MKTAFVIFDGMTAMDFIGIYDPLTRLKTMNIVPDFQWKVCARSEQVADDKGLRVQADAVGEPLTGYDLLVVPGGMGTRKLQHDGAFIGWLKSAEAAPVNPILGSERAQQQRNAAQHQQPADDSHHRLAREIDVQPVADIQTEQHHRN